MSAPTFEEAYKLPEREVISKAVGPLQELFAEMQRPYLGGLPPVTSYTLRLAAVPGRTVTEGLCVAQIAELTYWSADKISESLWRHPVILKRMRMTQKYSYRPFQGKPDNEDCANARHIFSDPNVDFTNATERKMATLVPEFFEFETEAGRPDVAAGFAVKAIVQATKKCGADFRQCRAGRRFKTPVEFRSLGSIVVEYCRKREHPSLCVRARFLGERKSVPGSAPVTLITIETSAGTPMDTEFEILSAKVEAEEIYSH